MKTVNIKAYTTDKIVKELQVVTNDGQPTIIKADKHVNYEFFDESIGRGPNHIITKRAGKDLHVSFERDGKETDLIIEDFYDSEDHALIGIAENGDYYYYLPDTGEVADYVTQLAEGNVEGQALGGEHLIAPWWVAMPTGFPWWLGLGVVPFLFDHGKDSSDPAPAPNPDNGNLSALTLPDVRKGTVGQQVTINIIENDHNVDKLDVSTLKLVDPANQQLVDKIVVAGQGVWQQDPTNPRIVTFTPETGFTGNPTPINYYIKDTAGTEIPRTPIAVIYDQVATPDIKPGVVGQPVTQDIIKNDGEVKPETVKLVDPATGKPTDKVVVPGEGVWTQDPNNPNIVTFTPETGFKGDPKPIDYTVEDKSGTVQKATVDVYYPENPNTTNPDAKPGVVGMPVTQDVTNNDGNVNPSTIKLIDPANPNKPPVDSVVVAGQGTWTVGPKPGEVTFTPEQGFKDDPAPINYVVKDPSGNSLPPTPVNVTYPEVVPAPTPIPTPAPTPIPTPVPTPAPAPHPDSSYPSASKISIHATDSVGIEGVDDTISFEIAHDPTTPALTGDARVTLKLYDKIDKSVDGSDFSEIIVDGKVVTFEQLKAGVEVILPLNGPVPTVIMKVADDKNAEYIENVRLTITDARYLTPSLDTVRVSQDFDVAIVTDEPALTDPSQPEGPNNPPKTPVGINPNEPISPTNPPVDVTGDQPIIHIKAIDPVAIEGSNNTAPDKDGQLVYTVSSAEPIPNGLTVSVNVGIAPTSVVKAEDVEKVLIDGKEVSIAEFFGAGVPVNLSDDIKPIVTIIAKDDNLLEHNEALTIQLTNPKNATIGIGKADGVIYDEPALTNPSQPESPTNPPKDPVPTDPSQPISP
ncbi:hypothetical protein ACK1U4_12005, partial [Moraxella sp. TY6]